MISEFLIKHRNSIITDASQHIKEFIPAYRDIPLEEIKHSTDTVIDCLEALIEKKDFKPITIYIADLGRRRKEKGIDLASVCAAFHIFKDTVSGLIMREMMNEGAEKMLSLLEQVEHFYEEIVKRLHVLYGREEQSVCELPLSSEARVIFDSLEFPAALVHIRTLKIHAANPAMTKYVAGNEEFLRHLTVTELLRKMEGIDNPSKLEEILLTTGRVHKTFFYPPEVPALLSIYTLKDELSSYYLLTIFNISENLYQ